MKLWLMILSRLTVMIAVCLFGVPFCVVVDLI